MLDFDDLKHFQSEYFWTHKFKKRRNITIRKGSMKTVRQFLSEVIHPITIKEIILHSPLRNLDWLHPFKRLESIHFFKITISNKMIEKLHNLTQLKHISSQYCKFNYKVLLVILSTESIKSVFIKNSGDLELTNCLDMRSIPNNPKRQLEVMNITYRTSIRTVYFPTSVNVFPNLKHVSLDNNSIEEIWHLNSPKLEYLSLKNNNLNSFFLSNLTNLHKLYLNENNLTNFRFEMLLSKLSKLKVLSLHCNNLTSIPKMAKFPRLNHLNLSKNEIKSLEKQVLTQLPLLRYLHLEDNKIEMIDINFVPKNSLTVFLNNNPFKLHFQNPN